MGEPVDGGDGRGACADACAYSDVNAISRWEEGINGTGVSRRPEANQRFASFVYYSYRRNRKKYTETINHVSGTIFIAFSSG
jgi:hypothetical protein